MKGDGVPPEEHELGFCIGKSDQQVTEIVRKLDHAERRGTNLQGSWPRVYEKDCFSA
jgi:hypothetical protein